MLYYICSFTFGFKLVRYDLQYSLDNAWLNYPHIYVPFEYKLYYLIQLSFYFHQLVVISVEVCLSLFWINLVEAQEGLS